jgi:hypothetical protein
VCERRSDVVLANVVALTVLVVVIATIAAALTVHHRRVGRRRGSPVIPYEHAGRKRGDGWMG